MALGNNNSMAQIKGKNKAVMVKEKKKLILQKTLELFKDLPYKVVLLAGL